MNMQLQKEFDILCETTKKEFVGYNYSFSHIAYCVDRALEESSTYMQTQYVIKNILEFLKKNLGTKFYLIICSTEKIVVHSESVLKSKINVCELDRLCYCPDNNFFNNSIYQTIQSQPNNPTNHIRCIYDSMLKLISKNNIPNLYIIDIALLRIVSHFQNNLGEIENILI